MADRVLTWHIPGLLSNGVQGAQRGEVYYLDADYYAEQVILHLKTPATTQATNIDINDDDVSIFTDGVRPSLTAGVNVSKTRHNLWPPRGQPIVTWLGQKTGDSFW